MMQLYCFVIVCLLMHIYIYDMSDFWLYSHMAESLVGFTSGHDEGPLSMDPS